MLVIFLKPDAMACGLVFVIREVLPELKNYTIFYLHSRNTGGGAGGASYCLIRSFVFCLIQILQIQILV